MVINQPPHAPLGIASFPRFTAGRSRVEKELLKMLSTIYCSGNKELLFIKCLQFSHIDILLA